eukprot:TRINITY_DN4447_c0_g1_i22.p2 TRINITY_DN4447_c0_g1~~TRINITY_DN4447_c0_g1_i22.p2  ORF type:complete len:184 (+),score=40.68 TRINITY_DN4447_c0_g1_i22:1036-1587(+)
MLRLIQMVGSVVNQERIAGLCVQSFKNLEFTRCDPPKTTLIDYIRFAAPRVGIQLDQIKQELAGCRVVTNHPVEALRATMARVTHIARRGSGILQILPESVATQACMDRLAKHMADIEHASSAADGIFGDCSEIQRWLPGSGSPSKIVSELLQFMELLENQTVAGRQDEIAKAVGDQLLSQVV